jgi:hypothetical protein
MAIGQKTLKVRDTKHEGREGTTDIRYVSESVFAKLEKKPGGKDRYKVISEEKAKSTPEKDEKKD